MQTNSTPIPPRLPDMLETVKRDILATLNCVKIGSITKFDGTKKTAQIQILFKKTDALGNIRSCPILVDCPVFTLQGGGGAVQMPIQAGDNCLVLFADRNIDAWFSTGTESVPPTPRVHDLADGIALVGINSLTSTMPAYDSSGNMTVVVPSGKQLNFTNGAVVNILGTAALALLSELNALISTYNSHTHSGNGVAPEQQQTAATGTTKLKAS